LRSTLESRQIVSVEVEERVSSYRKEIKAWFFLPPLIAGILLLALKISGDEARVFLWLNREAEIVGEMFWLGLMTLGDGLVVCVLLLPFFRRKPAFVVAMVLSWVLVTICVQAIKYLVNAPRPLEALPGANFHLIGAPYRSKSFPSGHAATASMFAAGAYLFFRRRFEWVLVGMVAILISVSRIAMGIHWPTDVLAGSMIGWLLGGFGSTLAKRFELEAQPIVRWVVGIWLVALAIVLLVHNFTDYAQVFRLQQIISAACLVIGFGEIFVWPRKGKGDGKRSLRDDNTVSEKGVL
jgi:membrane-associated phospholipid phosphatase